MTVAGHRVPQAAALIVWLVVWEVVGRFDLLLLFPPFTDVLRAIPEVVTTPSFAAAARLTVGCYLAGLTLAIVTGVALGLLMGLVKPADRLLNTTQGACLAKNAN